MCLLVLACKNNPCTARKLNKRLVLLHKEVQHSIQFVGARHVPLKCCAVLGVPCLVLLGRMGLQGLVVLDQDLWAENTQVRRVLLGGRILQSGRG